MKSRNSYTCKIKNNFQKNNYLRRRLSYIESVLKIYTGIFFPVKTKIYMKMSKIRSCVYIKTYSNIYQRRSISNIQSAKKIDLPANETFSADIKIDLVQKKSNVPFDQVPGPSLLKYLAKFWKFLPNFGFQMHTSAMKYFLTAGKVYGNRLSWGPNSFILRWLLNKYGPIVRLSGPFSGDLVILTRPEHIFSVFQNEGLHPIRAGLDSLETYRQETKKYKLSSVFTMNGQDWEKLRSHVETSLQKSSLMQVEKLSAVSEDFVNYIKHIRNQQDEVPENFYNEIFKWSLESLFAILLNRRMGLLSNFDQDNESESYKLYHHLLKATRAVKRCESGLYLWKFVRTPAWNSLVKHCDFLDNSLHHYIKQTEVSLKEKKDQLEKTQTVVNMSILETLLLKDGVTADDAVTILLDMLLIGVNATTHTVAFLLYHLAKYPRIQMKLRNEFRKYSQDAITYEKLQSMQYLQGVLKENFRLKPAMPILSRILSSNISIHNYDIPQGTYMLMATQISSLRDEYFEDANKFYPERWFAPESEMNSDVYKFATIPFGHGPKACLAREMVQLQLGILASKLLRNFRIEYHYGNLKTSSQLFAEPNRPLKLRFVDHD